MQDLQSWWFASGIGKSDQSHSLAEDLTAKGQLVKVKILTDYLTIVFGKYPGLRAMDDPEATGVAFPGCSYPEFVEVVSLCVILNSLNLREEPPPHIAMDEGTAPEGRLLFAVLIEAP